MTSTDLYYRATPCVVRFISRFKVMPANAPPLFPDIFGTASQKAKVDHAFGQALKVAKMFRAGIYARVSTFYPRAAQRHGHVQAGLNTAQGLAAVAGSLSRSVQVYNLSAKAARPQEQERDCSTPSDLLLIPSGSDLQAQPAADSG